MKTCLKLTATLLILAAVSTGCSTPPGFNPEVAGHGVTLPTSWSAPEVHGSAASSHDAWWRDLGDSQLNALIEEALRNSHDVRMALANLEAARAYAKAAGADLYPSVNLQGDATRSKSRSTTSSSPSRPQHARLVANASWEIDFWGKARQAQEAALADANKSFWAMKAVRLSLVGSIARQYIGWLSARQSLSAAENSLKAMEQTLDIVQTKARLGTTTPVDVELARSDMAAQIAAVASIKLSIDEHEHALALLAANPGLKLNAPENGLMACPKVRPGIPSELLQNRPDVREAEAALRNEHALVGVAYAAFFPSISLTGQAGTQSQTLGNLFGGSIWSLGASLDLPLFDFGRRTAQYERAQANEKAALEAYRRAAEAAYSDVRDALSSNEALETIEKSRESALASAQLAFRRADDRYRLGADSFLALLAAQRTMDSATQSLISAQTERLYNFVTLNEALGAGFFEEKNPAQP